MHTCAEKILEITLNDSYRSIANLNLSIVYHESIPPPENLAKSKMYADKVLYKDMYHSFYPTVGLDYKNPELITAWYTQATSLLHATNSIVKNILRCSKGLENDTLESINFNREALEVFQQHLNELMDEWKKALEQL